MATTPVLGLSTSTSAPSYEPSNDPDIGSGTGLRNNLEKMNNHWRRNTILLSLTAIVCWVNTQWITPAASVQSPTTTDDGHACFSCHKSIVQTHLHTAHYLSSAPANATSIKGSFKEGQNHYVYNDHMEVVMEKKNGVYLQTALFNGSLYESEA